MVKKLAKVLFCLNLFFSSFAKSEEVTNITMIIDACRGQIQKDKICDAILELQQIGEDQVEIIKQYIKLTEYQYQALTIFNMIANRRLRLKDKLSYFDDGMQTLDIRPDSINYTVDFTF